MKRGQDPKRPLAITAAALKAKLSKKRRGQSSDGPLEKKFLSVQLCAQEPSGPAQKYLRLTALQTVETDDVSIDGIKAACTRHFNEDGKECVLMLSDRGPDALHISQLCLKKPISCRFIQPSDVSRTNEQQQTTNRSEPNHTSSTLNVSYMYNSVRNDRRSSVPLPLPLLKRPQSSVPVSLSMAGLMQMGQVVQPTKEMVSLSVEAFDITTRSWNEPIVVKFVVEKEAFATGGFRHAYHAKQLGYDLGTSKNFVIKKFTETSKEHIMVVMKQEVEEAARKNVQMHMVARNFAKLMVLEAPEGYGEHLTYEKAYYATLPSGEHVCLEPYVEGTFAKYMNNNGHLVETNNAELRAKVEAFVHFTYKKSNDTCMVLDLQGCGYKLTDPEIATMTLRDDKESWLYCGGNMNESAITNFFDEHYCNKYCEDFSL